MASKKPKTIPELFEFYYNDFKPLYSHIQALNESPVEMLFEINAAFDHLSRHWHYRQNEGEIVDSVSAHLKRGCFDAFKIIARDTIDNYNELRRINTSIIDNGNFDSKMLQLAAEIKSGAMIAKQAEGDSRDEEAWHKAYDLWEPVYINCVKFDKEYYLSKKAEWARRKQRWRPWRHRIEGVVVGILAGLIVWWLTSLCS